MRLEDLGGMQGRHPRPVDQPVGLVERRDCLGGEVVPLEPHHVDAAHLGGITVDEHVWRHVVVDSRLTPDKAVGADRHVVMHSDATGEAGVRLNVDVPAEHRAVCDRDPVSELAVVGDMRAGK